MSTVGKVFAGALILAGIVWFLQGINILPGSYMTGDPQWAINGAVAVGIGAALLWYLNRKTQ